jgi:hypothetical protein
MMKKFDIDSECNVNLQHMNLGKLTVGCDDLLINYLDGNWAKSEYSKVWLDFPYLLPHKYRNDKPNLSSCALALKNGDEIGVVDQFANPLLVRGFARKWENEIGYSLFLNQSPSFQFVNTIDFTSKMAKMRNWGLLSGQSFLSAAVKNDAERLQLITMKGHLEAMQNNFNCDLKAHNAAITSIENKRTALDDDLLTLYDKMYKLKFDSKEREELRKTYELKEAEFKAESEKLKRTESSKRDLLSAYEEGYKELWDTYFTESARVDLEFELIEKARFKVTKMITKVYEKSEVMDIFDVVKNGAPYEIDSTLGNVNFNVFHPTPNPKDLSLIQNETPDAPKKSEVWEEMSLQPFIPRSKRKLEDSEEFVSIKRIRLDAHEVLDLESGEVTTDEEPKTHGNQEEEFGVMLDLDAVTDDEIDEAIRISKEIINLNDSK